FLDPDRLAKLNLTAADVVQVLREQNLQAAPAQPGQPSTTLTTLGRLTGPDQMAGIIIRTGSDGQVVRLKDASRIELAADGPANFALLDGKPAAVLAVALNGTHDP